MRPENEVDLDALSLDRGPPSLAELYENPVDTDQIRAEVAVRLREAAEQGNAHAHGADAGGHQFREHKPDNYAGAHGERGDEEAKACGDEPAGGFAGDGAVLGFP